MGADAAHSKQSIPADFGSVSNAFLRTLEAFLLGSGQRIARRNAWDAVCEDRQRAQDRRETQSALEALTQADTGQTSQQAGRPGAR